MAKILFFNVPTSGHIYATYPVVKELVRRGHEVVYVLTEAYRKPIEATGATFKPYTQIRDDYFEAHGLDGSNPIKASLVLIETCREILPDLLDMTRAEAPDIIIHDSMCPWGWLVAKKLGIPHVSSMSLLALTPALLIKSGTFTAMLPKIITGLPLLMKFQQISGEIKRQHGVTPPSFADFLNVTGTVTVNYTSRYFQPDGDSFPDTLKFVGPQIDPRHDGDAGGSDFPFDWLDERPLVYVSLGTVINQNIAFFREAVNAFAGSPYQVVMSIGRKNDPVALGSVPDNILVRSFVPQLEILKRTSAFVTHAGMNSVQEGLYFDVPLLLVPQQVEQRMVAGRVKALGAGLMSNSPTVPSGELRAGVDRLITEPNFKANAAKIGQSLRDAGGTTRAVDEILALV